MRTRYPDRSFVLESEQEARCATRAAFADRDWRFGLVIDHLLQLAHFEGELEQVTTQFGAYQSWARYQCAQSTYTILSAYRLWQTAYYPEALALLRHVLEVFVQIRFFLRHPDKLDSHLSGHRTRFREIFEELSPGSYEALYGNFLSAIAHGKSALPFRGERVKIPGDPDRNAFRPIQGARYERQFAGATYSWLAAITLGLLSVQPLVFPKNTVETDAELAEDVRDTKKWLRGLLDEGRAHTKETELFDLTFGLIIIPHDERPPSP